MSPNYRGFNSCWPQANSADKGGECGPRALELGRLRAAMHVAFELLRLRGDSDIVEYASRMLGTRWRFVEALRLRDEAARSIATSIISA